jgi:lysophospholipase L1-like esterase
MRRPLTITLAFALAIGFLACGGSGSGTDAASTAQGLAVGDRTIGPTIRVAALGDSITAGNPGFDPDPDARGRYGFGDNPRSQYEYWAGLGDKRLAFRNCGVFGETTAEIARRLEGCARGAQVVVIQGGINDIAHSLSGEVVDRFAAVDRAAENLRGMVRRAQDLGLEVELTNVLPWNNGHPYATPYIDRLNEKIDEIGHEEGVAVLPFHEVLSDQQNRGLMAEDWTADGDHPSVEGYRRLGELAFRLPR